MSMDIYAGKMFPEDNCIGPVAGNFDDSVNMSEGNAAFVLSILGFEVDHSCFEAPIADFIAACEKHLAGNTVSEAIDTTVDAEPGRCTVYHVGLREGYVEDKISQLLGIAKRGQALGATKMIG